MALIITKEIPTSLGATSEAYLTITGINYSINQSVGVGYEQDDLNISTRLYTSKNAWLSNPKSSCVSDTVAMSYSFRTGDEVDDLLALKQGSSLFDSCYDLIKAALEAKGLTVVRDSDTEVQKAETRKAYRIKVEEAAKKEYEEARELAKKLFQEKQQKALEEAIKQQEEAAKQAAAEEQAQPVEEQPANQEPGSEEGGIA